MLKSFTGEWNAHAEGFWALANVPLVSISSTLCVCVCAHHVHETEIINAHNGLSDSCMLGSQNMLAFISCFDWNCFPIEELERDYL